MAKIETANLTPMQIGRLNVSLEKQFRFQDEDGSVHVRTLREQLERMPPVKKEWDGMCDWNRRRFNSMNAKDQRAYEDRLKARRYYTVGGLQVPKIVYDAVAA